MDFGQFQKWVTNTEIQTILIIAAGYLTARVVDLVGTRILTRIVSATETKFDDLIIAACRQPIRKSIVLASLAFALSFYDPLPQVAFVVTGVIATWALFIWTSALFTVSTLAAEWLASIENRFSAVTRQTMPAWEMAAHLFISLVAAYFFFLAWDFDVTGWLASAGIIGVAVGFGAKDTMANLFAGVGILADKTYQLGDFLLLDTGERGRVTNIGLRSTRLLTLDEMEIIIPNSAMATTKIINESGGPQESERIHINVSVAYGSDVDQVRTVLLAVAQETDGVILDDPERAPNVMFSDMGEYALEFKLLCFIGLPEDQPAVRDRLNTGVYKALAAAGIKIPFPQRDVRLLQDKG